MNSVPKPQPHAWHAQCDTCSNCSIVTDVRQVDCPICDQPWATLIFQTALWGHEWAQVAMIANIQQTLDEMILAAEKYEYTHDDYSSVDRIDTCQIVLDEIEEFRKRILEHT